MWTTLLFLASSLLQLSQGSLLNQKDLSGLVGETIHLPCTVNTEKCGGLHNIKWYRGSSRIYVFSIVPDISKPEGEYVGRTELNYKNNSMEAHLTVKELQVLDEAVYKCEITYIQVKDGCPVVQFINLTTLIKPENVKITNDKGIVIENGTLLGPMIEDDQMTLTCESEGGKPIPVIEWWNGTNPMQGVYESIPSNNGIGTGRNRVKITVGRGDLGAKYECRSNNDALEVPMRAWFEVEVNVRPLNLKLTGVEKNVIQGTKVVLQCHVDGARPPANITWFNGTTPLPATSNSAIQSDGTYDTVSQLVFVASRFENEQSLSCEAKNEIMRSRNEQPMRETISLEVLYPPIITVNANNITVNESTDVLLFCQYEANPASLKSVKWLLDGQEVVLNAEHIEGGTTEQTTILIKNATRHDHGLYTCVLENDVGPSESQESVFVSIYFKPIVNLTMIPSSPVSELDKENITLLCQVEAGNPDTLLSVKWYLDGQLLKELPDCNSTNSTFCDLDPSKLLLEEVTRSFHGNYSCIGKNEAGWGPLSEDTELIVYYPPGPATLVYSPMRVVKRGSMTLSCSVDDPGRPDNTTYRWIRGAYPVLDVTTANWTIDPVTLETESNFTCIAVNLGGESKSATQYIQVSAPPAFIERLPIYFGALMSAKTVNLTCRIECSPICSINWQRNGMKLDTGPHTRYSVINTVIPPDPRTNDFESVQSTLVWNMTAWPGGQLDRFTDNGNYTCQSTGNAVGAGIKSTNFFGVEYPPENLTVSNKVVNVIEGNVPEKVLCHAKAFPEASYQWKREGEPEILIKNNALIVNQPVTRRNGGNYVCEAYNKHGNNSQKTYINVLYKPECGITQKEMDGKLVLICTAHANPTEVDFTWKIKNENETIDENIEKNGLQSFLTLETRVENFRTYLCFANNSVGMSIPCERDVTGNISWWRKLENDNLMIVVAVIAGAVLMVLIICVIIILVCRRKRASDKCPNPSAIKDKSDLNSSPNDALLQPESDRAFYENLPFHGMQNPPNKPYLTAYSDLDYADVDYRSYGPINYKAASIFAAQKKDNPDDLL